MKKIDENYVRKVYCSGCDTVFDSREKFEIHFDKHISTVTSEVCPIDTVISKLVNLFKRKSSRNLE